MNRPFHWTFFFSPSRIAAFSLKEHSIPYLIERMRSLPYLTTASATYSAQLIGSGKARYPSAPPIPVRCCSILTCGILGGVLLNIRSTPIWVDCSTNTPWLYGSDFNPGLYDLVASASWQIMTRST